MPPLPGKRIPTTCINHMHMFCNLWRAAVTSSSSSMLTNPSTLLHTSKQMQPYSMLPFRLAGKFKSSAFDEHCQAPRQTARPKLPLRSPPSNSLRLSPPLRCSSPSVSPNLSAGAATVPRSSSATLDRKDSLKERPLSCAVRKHACEAWYIDIADWCERLDGTFMGREG